jgi:hypothetical protein
MGQARSASILLCATCTLCTCDAKQQATSSCGQSLYTILTLHIKEGAGGTPANTTIVPSAACGCRQLAAAHAAGAGCKQNLLLAGFISTCTHIHLRKELTESLCKHSAAFKC